MYPRYPGEVTYHEQLQYLQLNNVAMMIILGKTTLHGFDNQQRGAIPVSVLYYYEKLHCCSNAQGNSINCKL